MFERTAPGGRTQPDEAGYGCPVTDSRPCGGRPAADPPELVVASAPASVGEIRRYAGDHARSVGWGGSADDIELLASEVATLAVRHAYAPQLRVRVLDLGLRLRVEVFESSPSLPGSAGPGDERAQALALVDAFAVAGGIHTGVDGTTIWFEVGI